MKVAVVFFIAVCLCGGSAEGQEKRGSASPHVLVYKANRKYRNLVAVELSNDKKSVVSYPDPADIKAGTSMVPALLHKGYLLDKRGIGLNAAFIKLSYDEYRRLKKVPSPEELYKMLVDKNPLSELCDCGARSEANSVKHLNRLIDRKELRKKCAVMK